jgi:hypothetical protein
MAETPQLRPATAEEIEQTLAFALQFHGRKRVHHGDELMARITAERLVEHLERSGFVVMKKPPLAAPAIGSLKRPRTLSASFDTPCTALVATLASPWSAGRPRCA